MRAQSARARSRGRSANVFNEVSGSADAAFWCHRRPAPRTPRRAARAREQQPMTRRALGAPSACLMRDMT